MKAITLTELLKMSKEELAARTAEAKAEIRQFKLDRKRAMRKMDGWASA